MKKIIIGILGILCVTIIVILIIPSNKKTDEIKIGVLTTLTGQSARYGQAALNGILLARDEINRNRGIRGKLISLILEDDGSETNRAVSAFRKLASIDKVPIIIGPISSSAAMACSPIANEFGVILFSPSAATPEFTSPNDYTFRNRVCSEFEVAELARISYQKLGLNKIAILYVNNDYGLGNKIYFENAFKNYGGEIVLIEPFDEGATDLRNQLTKIKQTTPDGIFIVGQGSEGGYILKQARELGIKVQFLSTITIQRTDVIETAGNSAEGVIFSLPIYDPTISEKAIEFAKKYRGKYGQEADMFAGNGYDALYIIQYAIEKGGYSAENIRNVLFNIKNFPGITGNTTFDMNGDVSKPVGFKKIQNGKFIELRFE